MESYPSYILSQSYASCFDQYFSWNSQSMLYSHLFCFKELFDKVLRARNKNPNLSNQRWTIKEVFATSGRVYERQQYKYIYISIRSYRNDKNVTILGNRSFLWKRSSPCVLDCYFLFPVPRLHKRSIGQVQATFSSHVNRKWDNIIRTSRQLKW